MSYYSRQRRKTVHASQTSMHREGGRSSRDGWLCGGWTCDSHRGKMLIEETKFWTCGCVIHSSLNSLNFTEFEFLPKTILKKKKCKNEAKL